MATFPREFLENYARGETVEESVANFAAEDRCWRIYRYRQPDATELDYSHYAVLGSRAEEDAMFRSEYVLDPHLVWERPGGEEGRSFPSLFA